MILFFNKNKDESLVISLALGTHKESNAALKTHLEKLTLKTMHLIKNYQFQNSFCIISDRIAHSLKPLKLRNSLLNF